TLPLPAAGGQVVFMQQIDGQVRLYRLALTAGATPEDLTARLEAAAPGLEAPWVNVSTDGAWYLLATDRFDPDCAGWPCLVVTQDFVNFEVVKNSGGAVHAQYSAIASTGNLIVYLSG